MKFDQQNTDALANRHNCSFALMDLANLISNDVNGGPSINQLNGKQCISGDDAVRNIIPTPKTVDAIFATSSKKTIYTEFKFNVRSIKKIESQSNDVSEKVNRSQVHFGTPNQVIVLIYQNDNGNQVKNRLSKLLLPKFGANCVLFPQEFVKYFF